jgi:hypothetical protein
MSSGRRRTRAWTAAAAQVVTGRGGRGARGRARATTGARRGRRQGRARATAEARARAEAVENWISVNIHFFAECPRSDTRQRFFKNFKIGFAECPLIDTRQIKVSLPSAH